MDRDRDRGDRPQTELEQLRRAMETRPVIDQARGVLMGTFSLTRQQAWEALVGVSQNTNTKLYTVAEQIVASVEGDALPCIIQAAIRSEVHRLGKPTG